MLREPDESPVTATIELDRQDVAAAPPQGRIVANESVFEFHGWLGLAVALEGAIEEAERLPRRRDGDAACGPDGTEER